MPKTKYKYISHSFNIATLLVSFSESKISCSIKTVLETTIIVLLSLQSQIDYNYPELYQQSQTQINSVKIVNDRLGFILFYFYFFLSYS